MDGNIHRRNLMRDKENVPHPSSDAHDDYSPRPSHQYYSQSNRHQGSPPINLKALKSTSLSCAKSLTNKLISLSNSGIQAASSAINNYKENVAASQRKAAYNNPNSFIRIAERISSTDDPIASHRELVAVIEHLLIWPNPPIQLQLERDRYGVPTNEAMRNVRLINMSLLEKILTYVEGRRDCCLFIIKFVTWRIRTTTLPEEVILSLEFLQHCVERYGGFVLALMTKSCMRRFRRLMRMTKLNTSIAGGVKKQLTKLLIGSSNMHPGVATDVRIHVIKAKVLYMLQLWHDVFLLDQGMYPVFFQGYREMRERGIRFPQIEESEKSKINTSKVVPKARFVIGGSVVLPLSPEELDSILVTVNKMSTLSPGPEYDEAIRQLKQSKAKIISSINILAERRSSAADAATYEEIMRKMLMLNDCVCAHLSLGEAGSQPASQLLSKIETLGKEMQPSSPTSNRKEGTANLLELNSDSDSDNNDAFDKFFGVDTDRGQSKSEGEDCDKFFAEFGIFGVESKGGPQSERTTSFSRRDYASDLDSLVFGNPVKEPSTSAPVSTRMLSIRTDSISSSEPSEAPNLESGRFSGTESESASERNIEKLLTTPVQTFQLAEEERHAVDESNPQPATEKNDAAPKKSLSQLMEDLDNMENDFSHMSMTGF